MPSGATRVYRRHPLAVLLGRSTFSHWWTMPAMLAVGTLKFLNKRTNSGKPELLACADSASERSVGKKQTHTHTSPLRSRAPHASGGLPLGDCCSHCPPRSSLSWFAIGLDIRRLLLVLRSVFFRPGWAPVTFTGPYNSGFTVGWYTGWASDLIDPLQQIQWCILGLECC